MSPVIISHLKYLVNPIGPSRTIDEPGPSDDTDVVAFSNAKVTFKNWITKYSVTINRDDVLRPVTIIMVPVTPRNRAAGRPRSPAFLRTSSSKNVHILPYLNLQVDAWTSSLRSVALKHIMGRIDNFNENIALAILLFCDAFSILKMEQVGA